MHTSKAYTIFGALFFNAIWIIYEWGSYKGYGGDAIYERHNRIFECIMAIAFACNLFLALFSAYFWLFSITANSSQDDYVYRNLTSLTYCFALLVFTVTLNTAGFLMGVYSNLSPNKPEIIISMIISIIIFLAGNLVIRKQQLECTPLECYHAPRFIKIAYPFLWPITRKGKEELKVNAKLRADQLKKRAYHERKKLDPDFDLRQNKSGTSSSVGELLRTAAVNLGRYDSDLSSYEARLEAEWLTIETMKGRSVDCLSKYMPLVLAEEVHRILLSDVNINDT